MPAEKSTWSTIRDILRRGEPRHPPVVVRRRRHLRRVLRSLAALLDAHPFLVPRFLAAPKRLMRGLGFAFEGAAASELERLLEEHRGQRASEPFGKDPEALLPPGVRLRVELPAALTDATADDRELPVALGRRLVQLDQAARLRPPKKTRGSAARRQDRPGRTHPDPQEPEDKPRHKRLPDAEGTTSGWDVVIQLGHSLMTTTTGLLLDAQALGSILGTLTGDADTEFVDHSFTLEGWLIAFFKAELRFDAESGDRKAKLPVNEVDEVDLEQRVHVKTWRRWTTEEPWEETDDYIAKVVRRAPLVRKNTVEMGTLTFKRVYAADLVNGTSDITIETTPRRYEDRAPLLEIALDAYFADEFPYLPITPEFTASEPWVAWPHAVGFTQQHYKRPYFSQSSVSLCFRQDADDGKHDDPFRTHILHQGRNFALGISAKVIRRELEKLLGPPPIRAGSSTITSYRFDFRSDLGGFVLATFEANYRMIADFPVTYTARFDFSIKNNKLKVTLTSSDLDLPFSLYLAGLGFIGWGGVLAVAIGKSISRGGIDKAVEGLLDLDGTFGNLFGTLAGDPKKTASTIQVSTDLDSVEINHRGIFLRGNLDIELPG